MIYLAVLAADRNKTLSGRWDRTRWGRTSLPYWCSDN